MIIYIVIGVAIILIFSIISLIFLISKNKVNKENIKITEVKAQINQLLNKKKLLLSDIKEELGDQKKILDGIENVDDYADNDFEYNDKLREYYKRFYKLIHSDEYIDVNKKSEDFNKLFFLIKEEEEALSGCIKYYNDKADQYNILISSFPVKFVSVFCNYKKLDLYNIEKIEFLDILK